MAPGRCRGCPAAGAWTARSVRPLQIQLPFPRRLNRRVPLQRRVRPQGRVRFRGRVRLPPRPSRPAPPQPPRWRGGLAGGNPPASDWFASSSAATEGAPADAACVPASSMAAAGVAASSAKAGSGSAASATSCWNGSGGRAPSPPRHRYLRAGRVRIRHRPLHARSLWRRCLFRRSGRRWPWERLSAWSSWPSSARRRHLWPLALIVSRYNLVIIHMWRHSCP